MALLFAVLVGVFHVLAPEPEKELAAFDAARAVPDENNAALIYAELTQGEELPLSELAINVDRVLTAIQDPVSLRESRALGRELRALKPPEEGLDPNMIRIANIRPWRSAEYPELKQWLDKRRTRIDRLLEAARRPFCYFPLRSAQGRMSLFDMPLGALRQNILLLFPAANNDLGQGDIDAALRKWRALTAIGRHLRAQPSSSYLSCGIAYEAAGLHRFIEFVVEGPATERHLQDLAARYGSTNDDWESLRRDINHVRGILLRVLDDQRSMPFRIRMWYERAGHGDQGWLESRIHELYHRLLSEQRGLRILIELRRFKDRTGQWPESLASIATALPASILLDPASDGPYVYRLSEDGFVLYSVGPNRIDEGGRHKWNGPDDWPIWPPRGRMAEQDDANEP